MKTIYAYWWSCVSNFGDRITPYLIKKISGQRPIQTNNPPFSESCLFAAGSILQSANKQSVVWGSGFIEEQTNPIVVRKICAVRGPLTKRNLDALGIPCPKVYGDPGILLPKFYHPNTTKKYKVGIIPHYVDKDNKALRQDKSWLIIDVQKSVEEVIDSVLSCEIILSSSLHGLIVANAYGIPSCWIKLSNNVYGNDFKFYDYYASLGIEMCPVCSITQAIKHKQTEKHENNLAVSLLKAYPDDFS